jgi:hypothetical protein
MDFALWVGVGAGVRFLGFAAEGAGTESVR